MGVLPAGPYMMTAMDCERYQSVSGRKLWRVPFRLVGTDLAIIKFFPPHMAWVWKDLAQEFGDLPGIVGRTYIVKVGRELYDPPGHMAQYRNLINEVLCEVTDNGSR